ncbi:AbrB family transcriptional regulator [Amaricoccus solimangrovi]|uniref:AbrB family transcriptional regulator n=1 Tax=Amaricoccus solimangrovi TaxID=2589815 RepID=A0A501WZF1_9RHOB|nr:AbrB family transcriptional regulator [Amaricoccus solimangrovi]TPE52461.1 AbrB family transcriptional regulator [Amaricoccus solimangrovi]
MNDAFALPLRTLAIGGAGAALAAAAGLPAGALIGSSLAVSIAAWNGIRVAVPPLPREIAFAGIGVSLGSGIKPSILHDVATWATSLGLLCLSLVATLAVAALILRRVFRYDFATSVLASSPGTMSYAVAVAQGGRGDMITIVILQSLRLLILASALPLAIFLAISPPAQLAPPLVMGLVASAVLVALAIGLGIPLGRAGLPASFLVAGMLLSGLAHALGLAEGRLPPWAIFGCFAITGSVIGTRFSGISARAILSLVGAAVATTGTAAVVSALFAATAARLTDLPLGQAWVAFAPGGVEAMAAIGLGLGYDPAYVAIHHLVRILFLIVALPLILGRSR